MKFSFGRGGGQISLNKKSSQNKVSYIGLKYLIPDGRVQNPKFVIITTPYYHISLPKGNTGLIMSIYIEASNCKHQYNCIDTSNTNILPLVIILWHNI